MKKLYSILVFSCICIILHAQIPKHNSLQIELRQTDFSYTTDLTRNDYYPEFNEKQDDYMFVHEADSSYMIGWPPLAFRLTHEEPKFQGGDPGDFCSWIGSKIFDMLEEGKQYNFRITVDFVLSGEGYVKDVRVNPNSLDDNILTIIKDSRGWSPEHHYWKRYCTPYSLHISSDHFVKGTGMVIIRQYSSYYFDNLSDILWLDSPERAQKEVIPEYQIASDKDIDEMAHLEDESIDLNQWIKSNIQDVTVMVGFGDGESDIELVISANGWVSKATVIKSYDSLLGKHLADELMRSCPRWVPAKVNGVSVPSRVRVSYSWRFPR